MTETSPIAAVCRIKSTIAATATEDEMAELRMTVGPTTVGVEFRVVEPGTTDPLPWDGESSGELQVRGPWIAASYYNDERANESFTGDGWLRTGDVATVDANGYIRLVDRTKDLIKSGGEWISSVELENELMGHPKIKEAAVIGVPHPKWSERPLACVVVEPGETMTAEDVLDYLAPQGRQVAATGRRRVHRRGPEDQRREVLEADAAGALRRLPAALLTDLIPFRSALATVGGRYRGPERSEPGAGVSARRRRPCRCGGRSSRSRSARPGSTR